MKHVMFSLVAILALASIPAAADGFETGAIYVGSPWTVDDGLEYIVDGVANIGVVTVSRNTGRQRAYRQQTETEDRCAQRHAGVRHGLSAAARSMARKPVLRSSGANCGFQSPLPVRS